MTSQRGYLKPFQVSSQLFRTTEPCGTDPPLPPFFLDTLIVAALQGHFRNNDLLVSLDIHSILNIYCSNRYVLFTHHLGIFFCIRFETLLETPPGAGGRTSFLGPVLLDVLCVWDNADVEWRRSYWAVRHVRRRSPRNSRHGMIFSFWFTRRRDQSCVLLLLIWWFRVRLVHIPTS